MFPAAARPLAEQVDAVFGRKLGHRRELRGGEPEVADFFDSDDRPLQRTGNGWVIVCVGFEKRTLNSICTDVVPGANGPFTVTRVPSTSAVGEEPSRICAPAASGGSCSSNGRPMSTRVRAVLTISSR